MIEKEFNWQGKTIEQVRSSYKIVVWSLIIGAISLAIALAT